MPNYKLNVKVFNKKHSEAINRLLEFLRDKLGFKPAMEDGVITINHTESLSKRTLKVWVKHFLQKEGMRKEFKVLAEGDVLTIRSRG